MPPEDLRSLVNDLKADVNNALGRIERTIDAMRQEFRSDFVTKGEFNATIDGIKSEVKDIKESTRWTIGTVVIPGLSFLTAVGALVLAIFVR